MVRGGQASEPPRRRRVWQDRERVGRISGRRAVGRGEYPSSVKRKCRSCHGSTHAKAFGVLNPEATDTLSLAVGQTFSQYGGHVILSDPDFLVLVVTKSRHSGASGSTCPGRCDQADSVVLDWWRTVGFLDCPVGSDDRCLCNLLGQCLMHSLTR
jgi:hypothetical protein